jgi:hypothetical protein
MPLGNNLWVNSSFSTCDNHYDIGSYQGWIIDLRSRQAKSRTNSGVLR